jgi:anti-sigma B factor antagonist
VANLTIQERGEVVMVSFAQTRILDETTIRAIGTEFEKLTLEAAADRKLLLNFKGVDYMSSAMLGQIMRLSKKCKADKINLKLCSICPQVLEVFKITSLNKVLEIENDEATALAAFEGGGVKKGWFSR